MQQYDEYFNTNRQLWDQWAQLHQSTEMYDLDSFLSGRSSLNEIELNALGDVSGRSLLHLQCHFGQDTLSWARMGAQVTGVDISGQAIALARDLNRQLGLDARFVECNIYDLPQQLDDTFDIVFTSYGTIGWLPELQPWAELIYRYLKPGGVFFIAEFHPLIWMFEDHFSRLAYSYFNDGVIIEENSGSYADRSADVHGQSCSWNHALSEVTGALLQAGLQITDFQEFDYSPYACFDRVVETAPGKWQFEGLEGKVPMVYTLRAEKT